MQKSYNILAKYYDLIYQQRDLGREISFIRDCIKKFAISSDCLIDVGCGTGSHMTLLRTDFTKLCGVDKNQEILDQAQKKLPEATFVRGGMAEFKLTEKADVLICMYSVFNYNLDLDQAAKTLTNFYTHLRDHAIAIIALYNERTLERKMSIHIGEEKDKKAAKFNSYKYIPEKKIVKSDHVVFIKDKGVVDFDVEKGDVFRIFEQDKLEKI